jgi:hypothetical protein
MRELKKVLLFNLVDNTMIMEKRNIKIQIKEMANFIMYVLVELVFADSYMYFGLILNAIIIGDGAKRMIVNP